MIYCPIKGNTNRNGRTTLNRETNNGILVVHGETETNIKMTAEHSMGASKANGTIEVASFTFPNPDALSISAIIKAKGFHVRCFDFLLHKFSFCGKLTKKARHRQGKIPIFSDF